MLNGGRVVAEGTAAELKRRVAAQRLDLACSTAGAYEQVRSELANHAVHLDPAALTVGVATDGSAAQVRALLDEADPTQPWAALAWCGGILAGSVLLSMVLFRRRTA